MISVATLVSALGEDAIRFQLVAGRSRSAAGGNARMPRFFFDLVDYKAVVPDSSGIVLPDLHAARARAVADATEIVREGAGRGEDRRGWRFEVKDESEAIVLRVPFADVEPQP